jgi:hypothetical protein
VLLPVCNTLPAVLAFQRALPHLSSGNQHVDTPAAQRSAGRFVPVQPSGGADCSPDLAYLSQRGADDARTGLVLDDAPYNVEKTQRDGAYRNHVVQLLQLALTEDAGARSDRLGERHPITVLHRCQLVH